MDFSYGSEDTIQFCMLYAQPRACKHTNFKNASVCTHPTNTVVYALKILCNIRQDNLSSPLVGHTSITADNFSHLKPQIVIVLSYK